MMFTKLLSFFTVKEKPTIITKPWKSGMWVVVNAKPYILHKVDDVCELHAVDNTTGETIAIENFPLSLLRQATYEEIPVVRRNISREQAKELGYGS